MNLIDFLRRIFGGKPKIHPFIPAGPANCRPGCHLTLAAINRNIVFFNFHDSYKEAEKEFNMLVNGHWSGFEKGHSHAWIIIFDYYKGELLSKKEVIYTDLSKKK